MTMSAGTYSKWTKAGLRKDLDCLKSHDRDELANRNRMLQMETNRRRKAQVVKRKMDAMKEERRRQEILMKRREQIREATERYQRLKKNYVPDNSDVGREQAVPALEEALSAIHSSSTGQQRQVTSTNPRNQYSPRSAGSSLRSPAGYYPHHGAHLAGRKRPPTDNRGETLDNTFVLEVSPGQDVAGSSLHAQQLHSHSLRNLHTSRNLFEQQLVQQQAMLVKQQQDSLRMFDSAIQEEIGRDYYGGNNFDNVIVNDGGDFAAPVSMVNVLHCDSPSSIDSLEAPVSGIINGGKSDVSADSLENHFISKPDSMDHDIKGTAEAANAAFLQHSRSFSSPNSNVAVVMPCFVQHRDESISDPTKEDRNNNNLGKDHGYVNGTTPAVTRGDPFNVANNKQFYQDMVINRVSVVNASSGRTVPVSAADQIVDWKGKVAEGYYDQTDNVWAHPLISTEATRTRYHTSSAPMSTTATIEGGNVVYSHNQAPAAKQAYVPQERLAVPNSITNNGVVPKQQRTTYNQMAPAVSVAHTQAVPLTVTIPSVVPALSATSYHCSQTVPGSFVTVNNVYMSQVQNDDMQQNGKTATAVPVPVLQWQAVSSGAKKTFSGDTGGIVITTATPQTTSSTTVTHSKSTPKTSAPKGILKMREEDPTVIPAPRHRVAPGGASVRHNGRHVHIKDSVEIIKEHQKKKAAKAKKKKSVRFADMEYEESESSTETSDTSDDSENGDNKRFFITSTKTETKTVTEKTKKSQRPISAQESGSSDSIDPVMREPRSLSAGTQRSRLCLQPHPPTQPPSGRAAMSGNSWKNSKMAATGPAGDMPNKAKPVSNTNNSAAEITTTVKETPKTSPEVIRGINGLSLSRTPTDDEISKLWQKVRSCLNSTRTSQVAPPKSSVIDATPSTISHKYMDGQSIVAQLRVGGQTNTTGYINFQREPRSRVRHKFSMAALNHYNTKKSGLLQQRRPSGTVVVSYVPKPTSSAAPGQSILRQLGYKQMTQSKYGGTVTTETTAMQELNDSMASFLKAEELSNQPTMTESQIEETLERSRQRQQSQGILHRPNQKAPSTLSLEEQRLLQSLDRLNQRLQANEARHMRPTRNFANYPPKPPDFHEESQQEELSMNNQAQAQAQAFAHGEAQQEPHTGMFRGRPPLTGGYRRQKVNMNLMRQQSFRGGITR